MFEDEAMIRAYQALQYNWFRKGQQRKIITTGEHVSFPNLRISPWWLYYLKHLKEEFPRKPGMVFHMRPLMLPERLGCIIC
ncbi:hypothetical protein Elgi_60580 [Paenibacillus elgii]|nr:hypothetical protein Elgi_60580 [Paenibacillus elgii]